MLIGIPLGALVQEPSAFVAVTLITNAAESEVPLFISPLVKVIIDPPVTSTVTLALNLVPFILRQEFWPGSHAALLAPVPADMWQTVAV